MRRVDLSGGSLLPESGGERVCVAGRTILVWLFQVFFSLSLSFLCVPLFVYPSVCVSIRALPKVSVLDPRVYRLCLALCMGASFLWL